MKYPSCDNKQSYLHQRKCKYLNNIDHHKKKCNDGTRKVSIFWEEYLSDIINEEGQKGHNADKNGIENSLKK